MVIHTFMYFFWPARLYLQGFAHSVYIFVLFLWTTTGEGLMLNRLQIFYEFVVVFRSAGKRKRKDAMRKEIARQSSCESEKKRSITSSSSKHPPRTNDWPFPGKKVQPTCGNAFEMAKNYHSLGLNFSSFKQTAMSPDCPMTKRPCLQANSSTL